MMAPVMSLETQLSRMEDARRQTQKQLQIIDRQITRRMTAILPQIARRQSGYRRGKAPDGRTDAERTAFWLRFHHLEGKACLDAGVAELKRMIAQRNGTELHAANMRQRWPALSDDQETALRAYAARHGRRWKSILSDVWMGGPPYDDGGILRGLRNTHGPTWLQSYRLPKAELQTQSDGNAAVSHEGIGRSEK